MARLTEHGLRRSVGVSGLFATAYGNVGSSIYYALGLVAAHALGMTPIVFLFAGCLFVLTAKTYAEGASMYPEAGGSSSFARHAFNEVASFFAGWALTLDYIITIAISAFFVPHYLGAFFPALTHNPDDIFGGIAVIGLLAWLNIRGIGESAKLNLVLAVVDLMTQVVLVGLGVVLVLNPGLLIHQVHLGTAPSYTQLIFALSVAMVAYTGIETVSNMAEEAKNPGRDVPKAVNLVLFAVLGVYAGISVVALSALPVVRHGTHYSTLLGTKFENDPVLGIVSKLGLHGGVLTFATDYVGILAATILLIATNAGMIGISRLSWSLAEHRQLPSIFSRLHARHQTPWFTILFFSVLAGILLIPGQTNLLGNLYSFGAMLSFDRPRRGRRAARQAARPGQAVPDAVEHPLQGQPDPPDRRARRDRNVRGLDLGRRAPQGGEDDRHPVDDHRHGDVLPLPPPPGPRPVQLAQDPARQPPGRLPGAGLPDGAGADLRRGRQRQRAFERGPADRAGGRRLRGLRAPGAGPAAARRRHGGRGGEGT